MMRQRKNFDGNFSRFGTVLECERRMVGKIHGQLALRMDTRNKSTDCTDCENDKCTNKCARRYVSDVCVCELLVLLIS